MDSTLASVSTDVDFSFVVERTSDGRQYSYDRGSSTLQTSYESASTSKLVTAVIILRLVDAGYLSLSDHPQDWISSWPIPDTDPLYNMTLAQLLSFTAGLQTEPACLNVGLASFETCVDTIGTDNTGNGKTPGDEFYYASTYLQVAGLMAIKARGVSTWQDVFSEFQTQTGLFPAGAYDLPSSSNPRLAGGMHWTGEEYLAFLHTLSHGELLSIALMNQLLADQTASATIVYSPALAGLGEDWHYGFGSWQECESASYDCTPGSRISSPGAYGAYPYWDADQGYIGLVARQGALGSFPNGVAVERAVRPVVEQWVACD
jgi:CubicO group peptidase (beta-lactamase class C family)